MNRQIVAFLSLFSLVLVLSIYYVMLPFTPKDNQVNLDLEDSTEVYFASLELQKEEAYEDVVSEKTAVLASSTATVLEKATALEQLSVIQELHQKELSATNELIAAGYAAAYVENFEDNVKIIISKDDPTKQDAAKIISIVWQHFGLSYTPEVSFRS